MIPRECWSAPVTDTARAAARPRLSQRLLLAPAIALTTGYLSAVLAARGHPACAGWALTVAVCSILTGATALTAHARRLLHHHAEAPCAETPRAETPCAETRGESR